MTRRSVRVDPQFFTELDAQLGETRGPNGEPSASDFLLIDLPAISEVFAQRFEELPLLFLDRDDYRYLVATGLLVRAATITAHVVPDGSVVLFGIDIDLATWRPGDLAKVTRVRPVRSTPAARARNSVGWVDQARRGPIGEVPCLVSCTVFSRRWHVRLFVRAAPRISRSSCCATSLPCSAGAVP